MQSIPSESLEAAVNVGIFVNFITGEKFVSDAKKSVFLLGVDQKSGEVQLRHRRQTE